MLVDRDINPERFANEMDHPDWKGLESVAREVEKQRGSRAKVAVCDIRNSSQVRRLVEDSLDEFGRLDILVNNAAVLGSMTGLKPIVDFDENAWENTMAVNLRGSFLLGKAVDKHDVKLNCA